MRKNLSILLIVVLTISMLFTACQSKSNVDTTDQKKAERVKLRILAPASTFVIPSDVDPQNNKWVNIYKNAFPEVDLEFITMPSAGANEKKTLMIASGDVPDMIPASQLEVINWSGQGMITPLDDIVKKYYPNIMKFVTADDMKIGQYEGKQWAMPVPNNSLQNPSLVYIRKDWLEKLNLKAPTTLDEAYNVMEAFTNKDPDGNGKKDTFGLGFQKGLGGLNGLFNSFDVNMGWWSRVNGKLVPDNVRPEMKEALAYLRKLFADGLIDKDSLVQTGAQLEEKMIQGKIGIVSYPTWGLNGRVNQSLAKQQPGAELVTLEPLKGPKGAQWIYRVRNTGSMFVVSSACKNPEYPAKILNWLLEQDKTKSYYALNADLINCGEVGIHGTVSGRFISNLAEGSLSEEGKKDLYRYAYRLMFGSMNMLVDQDQVALAEAMVKDGAMTQSYITDKKTVIKYGHYDDKIVSGPVAAELSSQLDTYFDEIKVKIVTGAEPLDAFDKWVEYYYKSDGQKIVDEVNKMNPAK